MSLNCLKNRKCLEETSFNQYWNLFFGPPPFASIDIQSIIDHCKAPSNFFLNCRSNLIMASDRIKQSLRNLSVLTSIHFLIDSVTASFSRGLAFETSLPVALCSAFSKEMVFWRFCYIFVDSVHDSNPWSCSRFEKEIRSTCQYRNVLDGDRPCTSKGISLWMLFHFEDRIYTHSLAASFPAALRRNEGQH